MTILEKSIRIVSASTGERVATRDAVETDSGGNSRVIQLVTPVQRPAGTKLKLRSELSAADGATLYPLPSDIDSHRVDIGDHDALAVMAAFTDPDCSAVITPLVWYRLSSGALTVPYPLESKQTGTGTVNLRNGGYYYAPILSWDVLGAEKISLHLTALSGGGSVALGGVLI